MQQKYAEPLLEEETGGLPVRQNFLMKTAGLTSRPVMCNLRSLGQMRPRLKILRPWMTFLGKTVFQNMSGERVLKHKIREIWRKYFYGVVI